MISSGVAVDGTHGGLGHPLHFSTAPPHMTFEPFLKGGAGIPPVPEFLRPLPKPAPMVPRYNGVQRVKYHDGPVNLVQHKEEATPEDTNFQSLYSHRLYPHPHPFPHYSSLQGPYGSLYPGHYTPLLTRDRPNLPPPGNPPLSPLEAYPSPHSAPNSPAATYSPPAPQSPLVKPGQSLLIKDRRFKVPSGKEGSLKHRILTRPESNRTKRKVVSLPPAEVQTPVTTNNNSPTPSFNKGSLIQLSNGDLKRVEDMTTEDFVLSAERSPALRLDPSTVVRIEPSSTNKNINVLTLSYGEHRTQIEFESSEDHPYFVYGQGWASCNPDKTLAIYGLRCRRLQVGDICISLSPRPPASNSEAARKKRRWSAPDQFCNEETQQISSSKLGKKAKD
uniref:AXH domain-containing protein n=1 Tax=Clastoptera arizonana TaxID=38151 RepID=A0A1B6E312_9HEMI